MREKYINESTKNGNFFTQRKIIKNDNNDIERIIVISIDANQFKDTNMYNYLMVENLDITFQQIINAIDASICWKNTKGEYIGMNRSNTELLKISNIKDVFYKTELELFNNKDLLGKIYGLMICKLFKMQLLLSMKKITQQRIMILGLIYLKKLV
ncbi:hypothetical protein A2G94_04110 [Francisella endosymbiont of Ornithodoros moubata]|nr:hypothetical protein A2G94_04110 [Francisella endosymbiont of Ornithodoros moubata]